MSIRFAGALALAVLLTGCVKQSADQSFGPSEEWRLRTLEEKALVFQNGQMELATRVNELERKVKQLEASGPMEQNLSDAPPEPLMSSDKMPMVQPPEPAAKQKPAPKMTAPKKTAKKTPATKSSAKKKTVKKVAPKMAGKSSYDAALKQVLGGKPAQGRKSLQAFMAKYPKSSLAPNAEYWLGETYYHQKRYAEAVVAFKKVHQKFPKHNKAAAALLKIGYCYANLGDKENARFYLDVLVQDYPKSDAAKKGRARLKKLN